MATSGIDVSQWQGTINWPQVKGKVDFALIRAGYGDTLSFPYQIDKMYEANYKGCKQAGIPVGVYFYSYASTAAQAQREAGLRAQAENFARIAAFQQSQLAIQAQREAQRAEAQKAINAYLALF